MAREIHIDSTYLSDRRFIANGLRRDGRQRRNKWLARANFAHPTLMNSSKSEPMTGRPWGPFYRNSQTKFKEIRDGTKWISLSSERQNVY